MAPKPIPLNVPPGFVMSDTPNAAQGRFTGGDKVRFEGRFAQKWSGWDLFYATPLLGKARGSISWVNQYGNVNASFGTNIKLYAFIDGDTINDITPVRSTGTINTDPFTTTNSSTTVQVTDTAHASIQGDYVTYSGATAVGGITIDGEYPVATVIDANTYEIEHTSAATSTATGGGGSVNAEYQINVGTEGTVAGLGWGAGPWGEGTWSTARTEGITIELRTWSLAEYGNDLLANYLNGGLYLWEEATDARAEVVTNAPTSIRAMFVTGERYVFLLGTSTPMTVQWPDQDDITDYTPSASNSANIRTLQVGSKLMCGCAIGDGVSLVWSDAALYVFQFTGSDFVYDSRVAARNCGPIAQKAFDVANATAFWMSGSDFWMYSGGAQLVPNQDDIKKYVFGRLEVDHAGKTWCEYDELNNQMRWYYCSEGNSEPDSYVDVDLGTWAWTTGTHDRTTGCAFRDSASQTSLRVDGSGYIYQHGVGVNADGAALESYLTFGLYTLADGAAVVDIMGLVPDMKRQVGDLTYEVFTKDRPQSTSNYDEQTATLGPTDTIADLRVTGRHFGMTVRSNVVDGDYRFGIVALEVQPAGTRR